jgi:catechol 2,3-dioxygenase-like lactoylglutathione lyase family enzyme
MFSHIAWGTHDDLATADFYERVMGMPLVDAFTNPNVPSTGDPYCLYFYDLANQIRLDLSHPLDPSRW